MIESAYIHIPFCKQKCNYCSFVSYNKIELKKNYLEALNWEIKTNYKNDPLKTIYFGGGTPSLLTPDEIGEILKVLNFNNSTEITLEMNPENVDLDYLKAIKKIGINRLSLGVQTFDDKTLGIIGRKHSSQKAIDTIKLIKDAGFTNTSIDLIYGLPTQTQQDFKATLETAIDLDIEHISLYGLKIEKGCNFYSNKPVNIANEDIQADMYLSAIKKLTKKGFNHYEISNFSKTGFESKHNLNYWNNKNYYGFGTAACGYKSKCRYLNQNNIEKYIENPLKKLTTSSLTEQEILEEEIFLGFRKLEGINIKSINQTYNIDFETRYQKIITKYQKSNHITKTEKGYKLTASGILLSNIILADFID